MRILALGALLLFVPGALPARQKAAKTYTIPLPPKPDFSALAWLVGDWSGQTTGHTPQAEIHLSVSMALDGRFMLFREETVSVSQNPPPNSQESWLGILSPARSGGGFDLRVYASTGFMTRYRAESAANQITLDPEGGENPPPGWLFRRTIRKKDSEITETVEAAPPGKPFFKYFTADLAKLPPKNPPPVPHGP